jgi:D-lactate dehydrogenase (cytochrome)
MNYNHLTSKHKNNLQEIVSKDRFSTGESNLNLHSKDQSHHPPSMPEAVIWPVDRFEVSEILKYANKNRIPITGWGSGSSLEGNPIPVRGGIVLDFSQMNRIIDIREKDFQADVEPGVIYQDLNERLKYSGLFFPPDPGARATIGGIIANNSSGTRTVHYGSAKDYVMRLSVVLADGSYIKTGTRASKTSSGYDLIHLLVGSEGTLGIVVEATVKLTGLPQELSAAIVTFPNITDAGKAVYRIRRYGLDPAALELLSTECIELINNKKGLGLTEAPTLFIEFHGPSVTYLSEALKMAQEICNDSGCTEFRLGLGRDERDRLFEARHELAEMIFQNHPDCNVQILDVAVPITGYVDMISKAREITDAAGLTGYALSHAGDGNIHLCLAGKKGSRKDWDLIDTISHEMVAEALSLGGTATGEHGVGIGKKQYMADEHGDSLEWMKKIKNLFDPNHILNPGKIF